MSQVNFLNYSIPNRVRVLLSEKNTDYIYILLNKHTGYSIDDLKDRYRLRLNHVRQELNITGNSTHIAELFFYIQSLGLTCLSIEPTNLRIDVVQFINKVR